MYVYSFIDLYTHKYTPRLYKLGGVYVYSFIDLYTHKYTPRLYKLGGSVCIQFDWSQYTQTYSKTLQAKGGVHGAYIYVLNSLEYK